MSALLGQQPLTAEQASAVGRLLALDEVMVEALRLPPLRRGRGGHHRTGGLPARRDRPGVRATIAELIREEFGDGIMSAIDFELALERVPDPRGDRIKLTLNGKFLPYRQW